MKIEVAYSPGPRAVDHCELELPAGSTVADAIEASGLRDRHAELAGQVVACGVWGRACRLDRVLSEGDRVEVYRALSIDPKDARRQRGREQKPARRGRAATRLSGTGSA